MRPARLQLFFWATQASEGKVLHLVAPHGADHIFQFGFSSADHSLFRLYLGDSPLGPVLVAFAKASPVTVFPNCRSRRRARAAQCLQGPVRLPPGVMPLQSGSTLLVSGDTVRASVSAQEEAVVGHLQREMR